MRKTTTRVPSNVIGLVSWKGRHLPASRRWVKEPRWDIGAHESPRNSSWRANNTRRPQIALRWKKNLWCYHGLFFSLVRPIVSCLFWVHLPEAGADNWNFSYVVVLFFTFLVTKQEKTSSQTHSQSMVAQKFTSLRCYFTNVVPGRVVPTCRTGVFGVETFCWSLHAAYAAGNRQTDGVSGYWFEPANAKVGPILFDVENASGARITSAQPFWTWLHTGSQNTVTKHVKIMSGFVVRNKTVIRWNWIMQFCFDTDM